MLYGNRPDLRADAPTARLVWAGTEQQPQPASILRRVLSLSKGRSSPCSAYGLRVAPVPAAPLLTAFRALCRRGVQGRDEERAFLDQTRNMVTNFLFGKSFLRTPAHRCQVVHPSPRKPAEQPPALDPTTPAPLIQTASTDGPRGRAGHSLRQAVGRCLRPGLCRPDRNLT